MNVLGEEVLTNPSFGKRKREEAFPNEEEKIPFSNIKQTRKISDSPSC